jgi:hypothetical protein
MAQIVSSPVLPVVFSISKLTGPGKTEWLEGSQLSWL